MFPAIKGTRQKEGRQAGGRKQADAQKSSLGYPEPAPFQKAFQAADIYKHETIPVCPFPFGFYAHGRQRLGG